MATNPYAAPTAVLDDIPIQKNTPALWNPNTAANWCLIFSPAFGAFVHMKNWQALGEPRKALSAKIWFTLTLVIFSLITFVPLFFPKQTTLIGLLAFSPFLLLIGWYFGSARGQTKYIEARFGNAYPHKGWGKPLLFAVLGVLGYFLEVFTVSFIAGILGLANT